jgi:copper(I)-binding protein
MSSSPVDASTLPPPDGPADPSPPPTGIRRWAPLLVVLGAVALLVIVAVVSPFSTQPPDLQVSTALVGAGEDPAGGYLVVDNGGGSDDLVAVTTPDADVILQRRDIDDVTGESILREVDSLRIEGYDQTRLQPGGDQLLLTSIDGTAPTAGSTVRLRLEFRVSDPVEVDAEVLSYDDIGVVLLPPRLELPDDTTTSPAPVPTTG